MQCTKRFHCIVWHSFKNLWSLWTNNIQNWLYSLYYCFILWRRRHIWTILSFTKVLKLDSLWIQIECSEIPQRMWYFILAFCKFEMFTFMINSSKVKFQLQVECKSHSLLLHLSNLRHKINSTLPYVQDIVVERWIRLFLHPLNVWISCAQYVN